MTGTVSVHHVEEGPPGAPVVVFSNSIGTTLIADSIPGARLEVIGPAAHLVNVEQTPTVTRLLTDHLDARPEAP
jgi:hypothetical protein